VGRGPAAAGPPTVIPTGIRLNLKVLQDIHKAGDGGIWAFRGPGKALTGQLLLRWSESAFF
jgi:hypothetical protein